MKTKTDILGALCAIKNKNETFEIVKEQNPEFAHGFAYALEWVIGVDRT